MDMTLNHAEPIITDLPQRSKYFFEYLFLCPDSFFIDRTSKNMLSF